MQVQLQILECIDTHWEITEEPYVGVYIGDLREATLGPYEMRRGDTQSFGVGGGPGPIFEGDVVRIVLREEDWGEDDPLGVIVIRGDGVAPEAERVGHGRFVQNMPPGGPTRYRIYFETRADDEALWSEYRHCLRLRSLHCSDAQQLVDHVYIKVDGSTVWGPEGMRTSDTESLEGVDPQQLKRVASIQLWEEDEHGRDDLFGELRLEMGADFAFGEQPAHTFRRDSGISGSAQYYLHYRVSERIETGRHGQPVYHC